MNAIDQLKEEVREGRISVECLLDVITTLQRQLEAGQRQLKAAQQRIEELEKKAGGSASGTAKVAEPFSMRAEEKRQQARNDPR